MKYYDPEYDGSHKVLVNLQFKTYKGSVIVYISGNCSGADILLNAVEVVSDSFYPNMNEPLNKKHCYVDADGLCDEYALISDKGYVEHIAPDDIEACITAAIIVGFTQDLALVPKLVEEEDD